MNNLILYVNKIFNLVSEYEFKQADGHQSVLMITGDTYRICPKGVGGAEVKGTLYPIPGLVENLVTKIAGSKVLDLITPGIEDEGPSCQAAFNVMSTV